MRWLLPLLLAACASTHRADLSSATPSAQKKRPDLGGVENAAQLTIAPDDAKLLNVTVAGGAAGVAARISDDARRYYLGRVRDGFGELVRVDGGAEVVLARAPARGSEVELSVLGSQQVLSVDRAQVARAADETLLEAGRTGGRGGGVTRTDHDAPVAMPGRVVVVRDGAAKETWTLTGLAGNGLAAYQSDVADGCGVVVQLSAAGFAARRDGCGEKVPECNFFGAPAGAGEFAGQVRCEGDGAAVRWRAAF